MPISDGYVVEYLLQATLAREEQIVWREKESGGYVASTNGIDLELDYVLNRMGSRLCISLSSVSEKVHIEEPRNIGFFKEKFKSEDQRQLARLMKELASTVARQCTDRRSRSAAMADTIRQAVYRRLIGVSEMEGRACT